MQKLKLQSISTSSINERVLLHLRCRQSSVSLIAIMLFRTIRFPADRHLQVKQTETEGSTAC